MVNTLPLETIYRGQRGGRGGTPIVSVQFHGHVERLLIPGPSHFIAKHSQTFEWGYGGSGPAQLALAILLDFTRDRRASETLHQSFKDAYVSGWETRGFTLSGAEIMAWLIQQNTAALAGDNRAAD